MLSLSAVLLLTVALTMVVCTREETPSLYQIAVHQKLKQKHSWKKINSTMYHRQRERVSERVSNTRGRDRGRASKGVNKGVTTTSLKYPKLNFKKYDTIMSHNLSGGFVAPTYTRVWRDNHQHYTQHKWLELDPNIVEQLYSPIETGHGYSTVASLENHTNKSSYSGSSTTTVKKTNELWTIRKSHVNLQNYPQCQLGYYRDNGYVSQYRQFPPKCTSRGMQDRKGLRSMWQGVAPDSSVSLIQSLTTGHSSPRDITNLVFFGDSVSTQLVQALICDLLRAGVRYTPGTNLTIRAYDETFSEFTIPKKTNSNSRIHNTSDFDINNHYIVRIHNKRFDFPCLADLDNVNGSTNFCTTSGVRKHTPRYLSSHSSNYISSNNNILGHNEKVIFDFTTSLLHKFSSDRLRRKQLQYSQDSSIASLSQRTVGIFNYGLHLQEPNKWILRPMVSALYATARKARQEAKRHPRGDEDLYLYRETSNQAFSFTRDGYHNRTLAITGKNNTHDYCCRLPLSNPFHNNWRNDLIVTYLNSLDLSWRETVGFLVGFTGEIEEFDLEIYH